MGACGEQWEIRFTVGLVASMDRTYNEPPTHHLAPSPPKLSSILSSAPVYREPSRSSLLLSTSMEDLGWSDDLPELTDSEAESDAAVIPATSPRTTRASNRSPKAQYVVPGKLRPYRNTQYAVESLYRVSAFAPNVSPLS